MVRISKEIDVLEKAFVSALDLKIAFWHYCNAPRTLSIPKKTNTTYPFHKKEKKEKRIDFLNKEIHSKDKIDT